MTQEQFTKKLFNSVITTILKKVAKELGVTVDYLKAAYASNDGATANNALVWIPCDSSCVGQ